MPDDDKNFGGFGFKNLMTSRAYLTDLHVYNLAEGGVAE